MQAVPHANRAPTSCVRRQLQLRAPTPLRSAQERSDSGGGRPPVLLLLLLLLRRHASWALANHDELEAGLQSLAATLLVVSEANLPRRQLHYSARASCPRRSRQWGKGRVPKVKA
jgi:hypothetical protein